MCAFHELRILVTFIALSIMNSVECVKKLGGHATSKTKDIATLKFLNIFNFPFNETTKDNLILILRMAILVHMCTLNSLHLSFNLFFRAVDSVFKVSIKH